MLARPWTSQPQCPVSVDRSSLLGRVLDYAWVGNTLSGQDVLRNLVVPMPAGAGLSATPQGVVLTSVGNNSSSVPIQPITTYPFFLIGWGYFLNGANNWTVSQLLAAGGGYNAQIRLETSSSVGLDLQYNYGAHRSLTIPISGVNAGTPVCMILQVFSETDYRLYCNGQQANGTLSPGTLNAGGGFDKVYGIGYQVNGGHWFQGHGQGRVMSDAQALHLSANPQEIWTLFAPLRRPWLNPVSSAAITAYYPGSDISVAGWTSSSSGSLYADIDDVALDRGDYITSPDLSTSATFGWKDSNGSPATIPAGSWSVDLDASYFLGASGQVRLVWLDAGGSSVGATSWQTLTGTDSSYSLPITTTGASTKFRYEVAP